MVNIGLLGCGYWGPNLLRNFAKCKDSDLQIVAEIDQERISYIQEKYPDIKVTKDYFDLFADSIDAVVIATQPKTHYQFAKEALEHGKHVLVEKPLAMNSKDALELVELACKKGLKLMVGHTFEYNEAIRELKKQIHKGTIGKPYYFYGQRLNFGIVRQDVDALWNLAPHDMSILMYLLDEMPQMVSARGYDFIQKGIWDVVFIVLYFPHNVKAHIHVSWLDPGKSRRMTVVGDEKMIVYDDMADNKIRIYDKGIKKQNITDSFGAYDDFTKYQLIKRAGDVTTPLIDFGEPLLNECEDFVSAISENRNPLTDGENGLRVVRVLEAAQQSIEQNGANIKLVNNFKKVQLTTETVKK
jgi:predicted dehydrogenase